MPIFLLRKPLGDAKPDELTGGESCTAWWGVAMAFANDVVDDERLERLVALRRDIHAHPELGFEEVRTSRIVQDMLGKSDTAAIAISPSNAPLIANAIKAANPKIPVMTLDADLRKEDSALRKTYLGTDNYQMGVMMAEQATSITRP